MPVENTEAERTVPPTPNPSAAQPLPAGGLSSDLSQQLKATQRASNEVAIARLSNQEGAGVQEWQSYQTPVSPPHTPNAQQAFRSERAIQEGQALQSSGPDDTPRWVQPTPGSAAQETQQAGQTLQAAGVRNDNAPLRADAQEQMQAALDNSRNLGQNAGGESRLEVAAQLRVSAPSSPSESEHKHR